ncbi:hypothetical protein FACS189485_06580 [Spirochaetia bacterium]|nr:hypothetical protein FACS189485_06580 [Spirochaetia bacterium]
MTAYIPVLCCSKSKTSELFSYNGKAIHFVASPNAAPQDGDLYCIPDDKISQGSAKTWRDLIHEQNHQDLIPTFKLYTNEVYRSLYEKFKGHFYIFSAGWGIVRSAYKLPAYNITYSRQGDPLTKRTREMKWPDFNHLHDDVKEGKVSSNAEIVLFAGTDYLVPFYELTSMIKNTKIIIHKTKGIDKKLGYVYVSYCEKISTNWFYKAANEFSMTGLTRILGQC